MTAAGILLRLGAIVRAVACAGALAGGAAIATAEERSDGPIEIEAESGIEWRQQDKIVLARGNAKAVRGALVLRADVLSARYRERADASTEIWQIEADGAVEITRPGEVLHGDHASYDLPTGGLVMTGRTVRLISRDSEITADRSLEYAAQNRTLTARGNAVAKDGERTVRADTLIAVLRAGDDSGARVKRIDATGNVVVITPREVMRGDEGTYDRDAQRATLTGAVKITRGENQLNGCRGELDLDTGVGRLFACPGASGEKGRVRGLIVPEQSKPEQSKPEQGKPGQGKRE